MKRLALILFITGLLSIQVMNSCNSSKKTLKEPIQLETYEFQLGKGERLVDWRPGDNEIYIVTKKESDTITITTICNVAKVIIIPYE